MILWDGTLTMGLKCKVSLVPSPHPCFTTACLLPLSGQCVFFITEWSQLVELSQHASQPALWTLSRDRRLAVREHFCGKVVVFQCVCTDRPSGRDNLCLMLSSSFFSFSSMDMFQFAQESRMQENTIHMKISPSFSN